MGRPQVWSGVLIGHPLLTSRPASVKKSASISRFSTGCFDQCPRLVHMVATAGLIAAGMRTRAVGGSRARGKPLRPGPSNFISICTNVTDATRIGSRKLAPLSNDEVRPRFGSVSVNRGTTLSPKSMAQRFPGPG